MLPMKGGWAHKMGSSHGTRSRSFAFILYEEDKTHMELLDSIVQKYNFAFIRHDKDTYLSDTIDSDCTVHLKGELKKPHYHVIIDFPNQRSLNKMYELLGLSHIETCNFYFYCRYLIHLDDPLKYQYHKEEIETNMLDRVYNAIGREYRKEDQDTRLLYSYIKSRNFCSLIDLTEYAIEHDLLMELKKNIYFYKSFCSY